MRRWFETRLRRFSRARRHLLNATLAYSLGTVAAVVGTSALILLSGWLPWPPLNLAIFAGACLTGLAIAVAYLRQRRGFRSPLAEAFEVESLCGGLNSRVVSAWDFLGQAELEPLAAAVVERAREDLAPAVEDRLDRSPRDRARRRFLVAAVALVALACTPWFGWQRMLTTVGRAWQETYDLLFPVQYAFEPGPGRHVRRLGESIDLSLSFPRRSYEEVTLILETRDPAAGEAADPEVTRVPVEVDAAGMARYRVTSGAEADIRARFAFGSRATDDRELIFTTPPGLVNMQTEIIAPSYTGQLPRTLEGVQQRLLGLPGTRLALGFTFNKDLESAEITWDDGQTLPLEVTGRFVTAGLVHTQARRAQLQVKDIHGLQLDDPLLIDFELQVDEKPQVLLPKHLVDDMPLLADAVPMFGFGARLQDDYGVTRCVLRWQKSTVDNPTAIVEQGEFERLISPAQRTAAVSFENVFEGLQVRPGDRVSFELEAADNRMPDKQLARSRRASFFVFQQDLGGLNIAQLGFGAARDLGEERIAKSRKATAVKSPDGLRTKEQVKNEFLGDVKTATQAPVTRGEFGRATQDYFRVLAGASYEDAPSRPAAQPPAGGSPPEIAPR
ncbi:MAG: hypothetical protein ACKOEX_11510 [Planctomycetia bacterium]